MTFAARRSISGGTPAGQESLLYEMPAQYPCREGKHRGHKEELTNLPRLRNCELERLLYQEPVQVCTVREVTEPCRVVEADAIRKCHVENSVCKAWRHDQVAQNVVR